MYSATIFAALVGAWLFHRWASARRDPGAGAADSQDAGLHGVLVVRRK